MPTITIKNGSRSLKFSKYETDTLRRAKAICDDVARDYSGAAHECENASEALATIVETYCTSTKPPAIARI